MNKADLRYVQCEQMIKDAFIGLIEEKGYRNITIKEISKRAIINRKTFYNHYESVEELFGNLLKTTIDDLMKDLVRDDPNNYAASPKELHDDIILFLHNLTNNKRIFTILTNDSSNYELTRQLAKQLLQRLFNKVATVYFYKRVKNVPIELLSSSLTAVFVMSIAWYIENMDKYSEEDIAEIYMELISNKLFRD